MRRYQRIIKLAKIVLFNLRVDTDKLQFLHCSYINHKSGSSTTDHDRILEVLSERGYVITSYDR